MKEAKNEPRKKQKTNHERSKKRTKKEAENEPRKKQKRTKTFNYSSGSNVM